MNIIFHYLIMILTKIWERLTSGGFTYLNPLYKEKDVDSGIVLDVNSLYPYVMYEKMLPFGNPIFFDGKYEEDMVYPLFIQMITCSFELKKNKIPTIQIKNSKAFFIPNEYIESTHSQIVCLTLTNVDLKLFFEQYEVYDLKYECGWKFKGKHDMFKTYIEKWYERKKKAQQEGNKRSKNTCKTYA